MTQQKASEDMATILLNNYKITHDGITESGPLLAGPEGLAIGVKSGTEKVSFLKRRTTWEPGYSIVRWADVTGYEITMPQQHQFAGSTINAHDVILTLKTAGTQLSFTLHRTDPSEVRMQLGPYLARIDGRSA
jgi:hypothetical protein